MLKMTMILNIIARDKKIFIEFLIFSSNNTLPSERDYCSEAEDFGISLVQNAFSSVFIVMCQFIADLSFGFYLSILKMDSLDFCPILPILIAFHNFMLYFKYFICYCILLLLYKFITYF